ncbi:hypothetical protein JHT19_16840 [Vibrio parahaemolyticus]|uniref:Uncharacterized protein n=1 Tax=Vibrio parahaemolyticus TaxID=670 RepID=A0A8H9MU37_VIBPH|nr:hypothetical protein [Vibrio parahaemolyticus]UJX08529.1 hypothetical protein JHT19_16840 [Vibrio parahaemolyticus]HAS6673917.1 hypothetical protein [Vibrio parahaemolyticus]HAS6679610.1 hypothetical protein [Vibrio parahaemolyticus]HAV1494665.1 hypothetical protein [Vibrio parahaemolyticus]
MKKNSEKKQSHQKQSETDYLLSSKENKAHLMESIEQIKRGKGVEHQV